MIFRRQNSCSGTAESTKNNPKQNPIELYHVRPSTPDDEKGRIKTIVVNIIAHGLDFEHGTYLPLINKQFFENIKEKISQKGEKQRTTLFHFYNEEGQVVETVENITRQLNHRLPADSGKGYILEGKWEFLEPVYIDMEPLGRVLIDALQYKVPTYTDECQFAINLDGKPVLLVKSEDGKVNKLFTDKQLKGFYFDKGEIKKR